MLNIPNASYSFKKLNPRIFGQPEAKNDSGAILARSPGIVEYDSKTEREFGLILEAMKQRGEILRYEYKGMTLRWFDMKYTPDFVVFAESCLQHGNGRQIKMIEVKGPHIHYRQQAIARFKGARGFWPEFQFEMHQKQKEGWKRIF